MKVTSIIIWLRVFFQCLKPLWNLTWLQASQMPLIMWIMEAWIMTLSRGLQFLSQISIILKMLDIIESFITLKNQCQMCKAKWQKKKDTSMIPDESYKGCTSKGCNNHAIRDYHQLEIDYEKASKQEAKWFQTWRCRHLSESDHQS